MLCMLSHIRKKLQIRIYPNVQFCKIFLDIQCMFLISKAADSADEKDILPRTLIQDFSSNFLVNI